MANLSNWYESKTAKEKRLIDVVSQKMRFVRTEKQYDKFLDVIRQYGIDGDEQFLGTFVAEYEGTDQAVLGEFVRDWMKLARGCLPKRILLEQDPVRLWHDLIQHDFYRLFFDGNTYLFKRHCS